MKTLIIIPAYNEAAKLPGVLDDLRRFWSEATILVINNTLLHHPSVHVADSHRVSAE